MLELQNVQKSFGDTRVLNGISLTVNDGEIVSILGPSGSGKTTLLNLILGITDLTGGKLLYNGQDLSHTPMEQRGFNIVFQDYALFPNLNARQNILYGLRNKPGISTKEEVDDLISLLGLEEQLDKRIDQLSGGQKQRVALARTLVMKPKILLLDEPLSALDGVIKESIKARIKEIARKFGLTTIIVTHDPEEALTLSDRVLILNGGRISQYAAPSEIVHAPRKNILRDTLLGAGSLAVLCVVLSLFLVIFFVPFVKMWPYQLTFTTEHITAIFRSPELSRVYTNSLLVAVLTAVIGSLVAYGAALVTTRSSLPDQLKGVIDAAALVINTIPGMVLGIAFLFAFTGTPLHNSIAIVVICNIIHFFSTPYLLMKNSLSKLSPSWETTAMLMGDSWIKTILRVVTPNAGAALLEMFEYYFINAIVTVSAVIFLCGARTMVITAKIKELQYMAKFDQIFALSLLILATNLIAKGLCRLLARRKTTSGAFALLINKLKHKEKSSHAAL